VVQAETALGEVSMVFGVYPEGGGPRKRWRVLKLESEIKEHEMRLLEGQVMGNNNTVRVRPPAPAPLLSVVVWEAACIIFIFVLVMVDQDGDRNAQTDHRGPERCCPDCEEKQTEAKEHRNLQ
jgi:hypothetical protein